MSTAKQEILDRIRKANASVPDETREAEYGKIVRGYRQASGPDRPAVLDCFVDRLQDYGCGVHRCTEAEIASTIAGLLRERQLSEILTPEGVTGAWRAEGIRFVSDQPFTYKELDARMGVLTGCAGAIALTGSIVLSHAGVRRALTLVPDYHLCVVFESQVAETVPEAIRQWIAFGNAPITTIAGPSATADIEMTRIKGVHGPRFLDVILVAPRH